MKTSYQQSLQRKQQQEKTLVVQTQHMNLLKQFQRQQEEYCQVITGLQEQNIRRHEQSEKVSQLTIKCKEKFRYTDIKLKTSSSVNCPVVIFVVYSIVFYIYIYKELTI